MPTPLRARAAAVLPRSHAPYSGAPSGVALGLASGRWLAAPRLESASFPLTVPALQGAWALAAPEPDAVVAAASTRPFSPSELAFLGEVTGQTWTLSAPDLAVSGRVPDWGDAVPLERDEPAPGTHQDAVAAALDAARRAVVPVSGFPVGAVVVDVEGRWVTGVNVEHGPDWTRGLCAERTALVAARAAGLGPVALVALACPKAPGASPCGGCRQLIAEQAPDAVVAIGAGGGAPRLVTPADLLPGAFSGREL